MLLLSLDRALFERPKKLAKQFVGTDYHLGLTGAVVLPLHK
jgi:hypothetical protein